MERYYKRLGGEEIANEADGEESWCLEDAPDEYLFDEPSQLRSVARVVRVISSRISADDGGRVFVGSEGGTEYHVVSRQAVGDGFEALLMLGKV